MVSAKSIFSLAALVLLASSASATSLPVLGGGGSSFEGSSFEGGDSGGGALGGGALGGGALGGGALGGGALGGGALGGGALGGGGLGGGALGGGGGVGVLVNLCTSLYSELNLTLGTVLKAAVGIIGGVLKTVLGIVGGILGGLFGGVPSSFDQFLAVPTSKAAHIDLILKLVLSLHPVIDKACPELGSIFVRLCYSLITIGISSEGSGYSDCKLVRPLEGGEADWYKQLNLDGLKNDWESHLSSIGGLSGLGGVQGIIYGIVDSLFDILGRDSWDGILGEVLATLYGIVGLLGNLVGGVLDAVLDLLFGLHNKFQIGGDISGYQQKYSSSYKQYNRSYFKQSFSE